MPLHVPTPHHPPHFVAIPPLILALVSALSLAPLSRPLHAESAPDPKTAPAAEVAAPKPIPSLDLTALDRTVQPCENFYRFACGGWEARNPLPPDRPRWGRFDELTEHNREVLHGILERAAAPAKAKSAIDQRIGDFYATCMDEAASEKAGGAPLKPELDRIAAIKTGKDLATEVGRLHGTGIPVLFRFGAGPDLKNAEINIANVDQSGIALPDRDFYLSDEARFASIRKAYPGHVQKIFELLGEGQESAARDAQLVLDLETVLAKASIDRVARRDPKNRDHKMARTELPALAPHFDWDTYFQATGAPPFTELNVGWPDFFKGLDAALASRSLDDWKVYLRWHVAHQAAPLLSSGFVDETFEFFDKRLSGTKENRARWKRCVERTDRQLGEALGQPYVAAAFGPAAKARTAEMVKALERALARDIHDLPWMTETTKPKALGKLAAIDNKIGYPTKWRDYSKLEIVRGDVLGNSWRSTRFEVGRNWAKIGQKVDPSEWTMSPPTVNAYYSPPQNNINFPAGILQPPFFDPGMDDAVNFGGIGSVIGHELTHGFDDQGRKFAPNGNLADWWTADDAKEFEKRVACIADQYSSYTVAGDVHVNGRLTLGENTADNGGLRIALMALHDTYKGKVPAPRDGFTADQRFFLAFAQIWCQTSSPESEQLRAQTDPHSPGRYRVNGTLGNNPDFLEAWSCGDGSAMKRENACRVW